MSLFSAGDSGESTTNFDQWNILIIGLSLFRAFLYKLCISTEIIFNKGDYKSIRNYSDSTKCPFIFPEFTYCLDISHYHTCLLSMAYVINALTNTG